MAAKADPAWRSDALAVWLWLAHAKMRGAWFGCAATPDALSSSQVRCTATPPRTRAAVVRDVPTGSEYMRWAAQRTPGTSEGSIVPKKLLPGTHRLKPDQTLGCLTSHRMAGSVAGAMPNDAPGMPESGYDVPWTPSATS